MYSRNEKLSLLSQMIEFAKVDKKFKEQEYDFILVVGSRLGVSKDEIDTLIEKGTEKKIIKSEHERILQFHRLVLLMNVDKETAQVEIREIKGIGLHMGLRPEAMDSVLEEMYKYPDKIIPPKEFMSIFTRFYN